MIAPEEIEQLVTNKGTVTPEANVKPEPAKLVPFTSFNPVTVTACATVKPANEPVTAPLPLNNTPCAFTGMFAILYFYLVFKHFN
jgi:hypothetical protein